MPGELRQILRGVRRGAQPGLARAGNHHPGEPARAAQAARHPMAIDRSFLPATSPMRVWPDFGTASPRVICAPLSGTLDSPRSVRIETAGRGYLFSPKALAARVARARALFGSRGPGRSEGKYD